MHKGIVLFVLLSQLIVVSGVSAQESIDPVMTCMERCSETHAFCVSTATFQDCIVNEPACVSILPRNAEVLSAFCQACGHTTVGCENTEAVPTARLRSPSPPPPPPPETDEQEQPEQPDTDRAETLCERQHGVWFNRTLVTMPDGTEILGVCRTPEGAELIQIIEDERNARASADEALEQSLAVEEASRIAADAALEESIQSLRSAALNTPAQETPAQPVAPEQPQAQPPQPQPEPEGPQVESPRAVVFRHYYVPLDRSAQALQEDHSGLHLRLQTFGHLGFTALHLTLAQMHPDEFALPYGIGFDVTAYGSFIRGWYMEGGVGVSYDGPDFQPFGTRARIWYHAGLSVVLTRLLRVGFGYLGSERFRESLQSAYSFQGAYLDFSAHISPGFVITLRGGIGAAIRPAVTMATDGLIQIMTGFEF